MRIWQALAVKEMLRYGESPAVIASCVGLPMSAVTNIEQNYALADTLYLQYEKDVNRCPQCGGRVKTGCFVCYQSNNPTKCVEVIERPCSHKGFMLNVHLYARRT